MVFSIQLCAETVINSKEGLEAVSFSIEMCAETMINSKAGWRQSRLVYNCVLRQ